MTSVDASGNFIITIREYVTLGGVQYGLINLTGFTIG